MAIGDQFSGLDMKNLIGGPLTATADASLALANSTAEFINKVGFDGEGNLRVAPFKYEQKSFNEDGTTNTDEMKVDVPLLAITPIPNLQVDEVNILFDMEVKDSMKSESATDLSASATGTLNLGVFKVSISGSVSSHSSNTRSSDNSAKYHVDVRATNHGTPEGLARVLDMMAASVSPALVGSTPKDANGKELSAERRARTERIKQMRQEIMQLENTFSAAQGVMDNRIAQLKNAGSTQQKAFQAQMVSLVDAEEDEAKRQQYTTELDKLNQSWAEFQNNAGSTVQMLSAAGTSTAGSVSEMFGLKGVGGSNELVPYTEGAYYSQIATAQANAVDAQAKAETAQKTLQDKKSEYNNAIMNSPAQLPEGGGSE